MSMSIDERAEYLGRNEMVSFSVVTLLGGAKSFVVCVECGLERINRRKTAAEAAENWEFYQRFPLCKGCHQRKKK